MTKPIIIYEVTTTKEQIRDANVPLRGALVYRSCDGYTVHLRWLRRDRKSAAAVADDLGETMIEMEYSRATVERWGLL
jgi:hypothetical protein